MSEFGSQPRYGRKPAPLKPLKKKSRRGIRPAPRTLPTKRRKS